ncbi:MAG: GtrA-like protein [Myxococcales bacterium]|nr:GtrA-like protein [Myxococcales bacterium]
MTAGVSGIGATVIDVAVLLVLVGVRVPVPLATFLAALSGAGTSFVVNKYVAFRDRSPINLGQVARFYFVAVVTALLMAAAMKLVAVELGVPIVIAKLGCAAILFATWSYPAQRRLVFARPRVPA